MVESELDRLITKRHDQRVKDDGERPAEELYMESVRRHEELERRERLWQLLRFHQGMARSHTANLEALVNRHRLEVERCEALLGITDTKGVA